MSFFEFLKNYVFSSSEEKDEPTEFYKLIDERRAVLDKIQQLATERESIDADNLLDGEQIKYINDQINVLMKYARILTERIEIQAEPLSKALG